MTSVLVPIVGMMIPMVIVPTSLIAKHLGRKRELDHVERVRSMELGVVPPPTGQAWPAAMAAAAIGVLVPIGSFAMTLAAVVNVDAPGEIWFAPVAVSFMALLTARKVFERGQAAQPGWQVADRPSAFAKPAFDPDAYDVVGSRG